MRSMYTSMAPTQLHHEQRPQCSAASTELSISAGLGFVAAYAAMAAGDSIGAMDCLPAHDHHPSCLVPACHEVSSSCSGGRPLAILFHGYLKLRLH